MRPHHKEQFDRTCCEIIGQGCGFKPEDAVLKKRPAPGAVVGQEKKARLDEGKDTKLTSKDTVSVYIYGIMTMTTEMMVMMTMMI